MFTEKTHILERKILHEERSIICVKRRRKLLMRVKFGSEMQILRLYYTINPQLDVHFVVPFA